MNIYRHQFVAACPNNKKAIIYALEVQSARIIYAEHIVTACALWREGFHEAIADELFRRFGERQILRAHHHGVDIETRRGFD